METELSAESMWRFKHIVGHQGPLRVSDPNYKGSSYNVLVEWEDGSITSEPLKIIAADDPVTVARYAKENNLLDLEGWKRFKRLAKRDGKMIRMMNQARLRSVRRAPLYQFGYRVPRNPREATEIDKGNGNRKWQESQEVELQQLGEYNTFEDKGLHGLPPAGYKRITVHFVYAVKHDGRHKARLVANGAMTAVPVESVYSGVVSLRSLRTVIFLAELNGLSLHSADVGNAYLEAKTKEKVYIVAGEGFGELEGHTLIIVKALYGLRTSGLRWHERFADTLRNMGFQPSRADADVWMRRNGNIYEYIAVYVDDLAIAALNPSEITSVLVDKYGYKLKGVGPMQYHLGCDFERDADGTLSYGPKKYIKKMMDTYQTLFGETPRDYASPLEKGDHPELDDSEFLPEDDAQKYQSMVGAAQWLISLGRFDVAAAVMTMSGFRIAPRRGHMKRMQRIYGYVKKFPHGCIRVRTEAPDYSSLEHTEHDWAYTVYGNVEESIPSDIPTPLGKPVVVTTYFDANLYHDLTTGRAVTGVLHLLNKTPIEWYSRKQATVETATYGAEFVAARIATEQVIDLRNTLRYFGVPLSGPTYMFGDNNSVILSASVPSSSLHKRHNALSYHRVREAIAAKIMWLFHISGKANPADILSKHTGHQEAWPLVKPLLFWKGDTSVLA